MSTYLLPPGDSLAQEYRQAAEEYDQFLGEPYTRVYYDWSLHCLVRCTVQQPKTPNDRVAVSPALAQENREDDPLPTYSQQSKTKLFHERITALLSERPMNAHQLADATGETVNRVKGLIRNHPYAFVVLGQSRFGSIYGLKCKQYETPIYLKSMGRMVEYIQEHGPSTLPDVCRGIGITVQSFNNAVKANPGVLEVVGHKKIPTSKKPVQVWDLARVQEAEEIELD